MLGQVTAKNFGIVLFFFCNTVHST